MGTETSCERDRRPGARRGETTYRPGYEDEVSLPIERLNAAYLITKHLAYRGKKDRTSYINFRKGRGRSSGVLIKDFKAHEKLEELEKEIGALSSSIEFWLERAKGITID